MAVAAVAASLCLGAGSAAVAGAGAATPPAKAKGAPAAAAAREGSAAVQSAVSALQAASHIQSKAAREAAERAAIANLESAVRAATAHVKPKASALANMRSAATKRAEQLLRRPVSVATGRQVRRPGLQEATNNSYGSGFSTSGNWSGYVDTNENYDYVFGEWTVPSANCGPWYDFSFSQSSTWVGIDGWGSGTVEQLGTATGCVFGASTYYGWTEMYPQIEDPIFEPVSPGDQMMALTFAYGGGTQYELWMADLSEGWSWVRFASTSSPLSDSSAEWITERPSCGPFCNSLTNFGTTTFTNAYAIGNNSFGAINAFPNYAVDMWNGGYDAVVGGLGAGGTQFTDWWEHS